MSGTTGPVATAETTKRMGSLGGPTRRSLTRGNNMTTVMLRRTNRLNDLFSSFDPGPGH